MIPVSIIQWQSNVRQNNKEVACAMLWQEAGRSIGEYNVSRTMAKSERVKFIAAATTRISKVTRYAVNIVAIYLGNCKFASW